MIGRRATVLAALAILALGPGCKRPEAAMDLNPLDNVPPQADKAVRKGDLAIWAMAFPDGRVLFYLIPPQGLRPVVLEPRMGKESFPVRWKVQGRTPLFSWPVVLGNRMRNRVFTEPLVVDLSYVPGTAPRRLVITGLGEPNPFLNICYFDLTWEER